MRKVCLYYSPNQICLLESELQRLKSLHAIYPQLIVRSQIPSKFTPKQSYIRLTSSQHQPIVFVNLRASIVYCLKLDQNKKRQIIKNYQKAYEAKNYEKNIYVTNQFKEIVIAIVKQLGYEQPKGQNVQKMSPQRPNSEQIIQKGEQNRFNKQAEYRNTLKYIQQMVPRQQFMNLNHVKETSKLLKLEIGDIQKCDAQDLAKCLQRQLKSYLKSKQIQILDKQFNRIRQSKSISELCRACLHFYTLQHYSLYHDLNFLLRNIRSIIFKQKIQKLKLFAFLLILNYLYVYSGSYGIQQANPPPILYRYTDALVNPELVGKIVTIPSFYSATARQDLTSFRNKNTKIIIHPLGEANASISIKSIYPIHIYSAFKKQQEYLYIPFTCFIVTQVRYRKSQQKWVVDIKQIPGNPIIKNVLDINLFNSEQDYSKSNLGKPIKNMMNQDSQQMFSSEWQLKCQQRYEYSKDLLVKIKTSLNLGIIFLRLMQKNDIAISYFNQGVDLIVEAVNTGINSTSKSKDVKHLAMLIKALNYLGVAFMKNQKLDKSTQMFQKAEKYIEQLTIYHDQRINKKQQNTIVTAVGPIQSVPSTTDKPNNKANTQSMRPNLKQNLKSSGTKVNKKQEETKQQQMTTPVIQKTARLSLPDELKYLYAGLKNNESFLNQAKGNFQQAIRKYKQALCLLKSCHFKNELMEACILNNIGSCLSRSQSQTQKQQSLNYFKDSFKQYLKVYGIYISSEQQSPTKQNPQKQNPQKQLRNLTKFINDSQTLISELIPIFQNLSQFYEGFKDNTQMALFYQESAVALYRKLRLVQQKQSSTLMYMKSRYSKLLIKAQRFKQSIAIYQQLLPIARLIDASGLKSAMFKANIASVFVNMGTNQDFKNAVFWYSEAIRDISTPLLSENLEFYNKISDMKSDIEKYCINFESDSNKIN